MLKFSTACAIGSPSFGSLVNENTVGDVKSCINMSCDGYT